MLSAGRRVQRRAKPGTVWLRGFCLWSADLLTTNLIGELENAVGPGAVLTDDDSRERLSFDAIGRSRFSGRESLAESRVDAVVRPATTAQVAAVVRAAAAAGVAIIPYGGGTGVMGAVVPFQGGVAVDLRRMDAILDVSTADRLARVQPGVVLADLDAEARRHGLLFGHDPWSLPIATVGGAISTDSVGYRASKYGSMGQQVRAVEMVLGDGAVARTRPLARQSSGPQLVGTVVGSEGSMGIITEATVELFAEPEARTFSTFGFASFAQGYPLVVRLFDMGLRPSLIDLTEEEPHDLAQGFSCLLYLGFEGYREEVAAQQSRTTAEALAAGGADLGPAATERYWHSRHAVAERWRERTAPLRPTERWACSDWRGADYLHVSLPASRVLDYEHQAQAIAASHGLEMAETAVWTDPRLFSMLIVDPQHGSGGSEWRLATAADALLDLALSMDGGVEYCHGIGIKLDRWMPREWGGALVLARRLKAAVDPASTLNPGKLGL